MKRWQIIAVIVISLVTLGLVGGNALTSASRAASQQLFEVRKSDLNITVSGGGNIEPSDDASLTFSTSGRIDRIYVEEDDEVNEGDILARFDITSLERAVIEAESRLGIAQTNLDKLLNPPNLAADIREAEADIESAKAALAYLVAIYIAEGSYPEGLQKKSQMESAEATLIKAEERLADLLDGPDERDVQLSEHEMTMAELTLAEAKRKLEEATITAPFDGIIANVYVEEGDMVPSPNIAPVPVIQLVNYERMELLVEIDEMDIPYVKAGQEATITVDALPGAEFVGEVTTIFPVPREIVGVVLYDVKIEFNVPDDSDIRVGMNATAHTTFTMRSNVVLAPNRAIGQDNEGTPMVKVMVNDQIQERLVIVGVSNGFETEIISGLSEGDMVVSRL
jgi:RND family efflux transporter MFP subunit